jgi:hypothetical protein
MVGDRVLGRFTLDERIGAGGFGTVYRGWDERLERRVAVKVIEAGGGAGRRVLREAQAAARLNHPGIVTLYELGEEAGHAYLVSELVEGSTLHELTRDGALSDRDAAEIGAELCAALDHAHSHGVVHRDIKPQNVVVRDPAADSAPASSHAKLMDFGTASLIDGPALTATGEVIGTIAYMAPEQAEGAPAGPPVDVYALALTLYECYAGEHPFARSTPAATARAIGGPAPSLADHRRDLPAELCDLIDCCLAREPERRPQLEELRDGLERAAPSLSEESVLPEPVRTDHRISTPSPRAVSTARIGIVAALSALVAWLGLAGGLPGAALAVALLVLPLPLIFPAPAQWGAPALAPLLGAAGLAPVYPALCALAGTPLRRALLAAYGSAWLIAAEAILGSRLLLGVPDQAPRGWEHSLADAATGVLLPVFAPEAILITLVWAGAAVVLGAVIRGRMIALELLGVLLWAAAVVAVHEALAGGAHAPAAAPITIMLVAVAVVALWARATRAPGGIGRPRPLP